MSFSSIYAFFSCVLLAKYSALHRYPGAGSHRSRSSGPGQRYNTIQAGICCLTFWKKNRRFFTLIMLLKTPVFYLLISLQKIHPWTQGAPMGRYTGYRERTKSAPPGGRRQRSRSEDSAMTRRRPGERRTMTSFSLHPSESRSHEAGVRPVTPGRTKYDVDRQSSYYSRRAQSFIDKRYLPT